MAGLCCCASHGGIISIQGLAASSGSPWILQAPNLHFSVAVGKGNRILIICSDLAMNLCSRGMEEGDNGYWEPSRTSRETFLVN